MAPRLKGERKQVREKKAQVKAHCSVVSRSSGRDKLRHFAPRPDPVRHLQWLPVCVLVPYYGSVTVRILLMRFLLYPLLSNQATPLKEGQYSSRVLFSSKIGSSSFHSSKPPRSYCGLGSNVYLPVSAVCFSAGKTQWGQGREEIARDGSDHSAL